MNAQMVKVVQEAIEYNEDFIEYLNVQIDFLQKKGTSNILIDTYREQIDRCEVIIMALKKRLPMKPKKVESEYYNGLCPICDEPVIYKMNCQCCCQRLDWSE